MKDSPRGPLQRIVGRQHGSAGLTVQIAAMQKAAAILLREAAALRECHTCPDGDWSGEDDAREAYDEMQAVAFELRQCADDSMFAHRLANELECVLLHYQGRYWNSAMAVLSEYRDIESRIAQRECPTQFGEPTERDCTHCGGFGEVTGEYPGIACQDCQGTGKLPPNAALTGHRPKGNEHDD